MHKCRICLSNSKNILSIFASHDGKSFAYMISSFANVKIVQNNGITEEICKICCQKLIDAYNFKVQIESSDEILKNAAGWKVVSFGNLYDLKTKIGITHIPKYEKTLDDYFNNEETSIFFNDTSITKVKVESVPIKNENDTLSDSFENLNTETNFDDNYDIDNSCVAEFDNEDALHLPLSRRQTKLNKSSAKSKRRTKKKPQKVLFIPVYLNDIQVISAANSKQKVGNAKEKRRKKFDMCNYCGKMSAQIKTHLLVHTGKRSHKCEICSKAYFTAKSLENHLKLHNKEKKFKCDKCVAAFITSTALESHNIMHKDEKKYVCDICHKPFKREGALMRHKLMHNMANKSIKCELCNMSFFANSGLKHHLRVHTGERPFNCELCSQPYSYKHDFNRHCFKKHGIFLKRRNVYVMNEEVLKRERALMRDLMLKMQGVEKKCERLNPFEAEGPQAALAFEQAIKALEAKKICVDFNN